MADWDDTSPADNDIVSQYPANERDARAAVVTNFGVDHHETNDADVGKHEVIQVMDNAADPTIDAGEVGIWNNGGVLKSRVGAASPKTFGYQGELDAPAGTKLVFYQASAPTGWTQDTGVNDQVLKVVSGTGGGTGGSWTISGVTVDNHTLTTSEIPAHNHTMGTAGSHNHGGSTGNDAHSHDFDFRSTSGPSDGSGFFSTEDSPSLTQRSSANASADSAVQSDTHNHSISSDGGHTHTVNNTGGGNGHNHGVTSDGSWRPSHIDVIVAAKD